MKPKTKTYIFEIDQDSPAFGDKKKGDPIELDQKTAEVLMSRGIVKPKEKKVKNGK